MSEQPPETGNIEMPLDFDLTSLNNGEKRVMSQETGVNMQTLVGAMQTAESAKKGKNDSAMLHLKGVDLVDIEYAFGRIALRRRYGIEADTPANADRVTLNSVDGVDPTPAVS